MHTSILLNHHSIHQMHSIFGNKTCTCGHSCHGKFNPDYLHKDYYQMQHKFGCQSKEIKNVVVNIPYIVEEIKITPFYEKQMVNIPLYRTEIVTTKGMVTKYKTEKRNVTKTKKVPYVTYNNVAKDNSYTKCNLVTRYYVDQYGRKSYAYYDSIPETTHNTSYTKEAKVKYTIETYEDVEEVQVSYEELDDIIENVNIPNGFKQEMQDVKISEKKEKVKMTKYKQQLENKFCQCSCPICKCNVCNEKNYPSQRCCNII